MVNDERCVVAVVGGVEKFFAEGEALLGADVAALSALDALPDKKPNFLVRGQEIDGMSRTDFDAEFAADAGLAVVGHFAAEFGGRRDGGIESGFAASDFLQQSGHGRGEVGGRKGVGVRLAEEVAEQFWDHGEGHGGYLTGYGR